MEVIVQSTTTKSRGAEAGSILGVNTSHFLGTLKNGSWRVWDNKKLAGWTEKI